jgi:PDZ domain-containing protein
MSRRALTLVVAAGLSFALIVLGAVLPVPYVALLPGPVTDTLGKSSTDGPLISVSGHPTYPTDGHLYLTTVEVYGDPHHQPTLLSALSAWLDRTKAVVPQQLIYPPGQTGKQVEEENTREMQESQQHAITAALRQLGIQVKQQIVIAQITKGAPAAGKLQRGDVVLAVDGKAVPDEPTLRKLIGQRKPGESVRIEVRRAARTLEVTVGTIAANDGTNRAIVGVLTEVRRTFPFTVDIGLKDVGGPSAGLMFALGLVDKLTPGDLTGGRSIAGTGTIDDSGAVGPIGGIQQKVVAASRAGATVFLVPAADCTGARQASTRGVRLVRVDTLRTAISALEALDRGSNDIPHC